MIQLIAPYLTTLKEIGFIVVMVLLGQLGQNRFNNKDEEDIKGLDLVIAVLILSSAIYFGLKRLPFPEFKYLTALVFGLSGTKLIKKWLRKEIWNNYDKFITKGDKK